MDASAVGNLLGTPCQFVVNQGVFRLPGYHEEEQQQDLIKEGRLKDIVSNAKDRSCDSIELMSSLSGWFNEYHLSPKRSRLIRVFDYASSIRKVLELGCECGAISRCLGELIPRAQITAVEARPSRAEIASLRTKDLANVNVVAGPYDELKPNGSFDLVTSIGFLEYAPMLFNGEFPFEEALRLMHNALNSNGTLILAMANQFGLKYLIGYPEDHTDLDFEGLQGYPRTGGKVRTFGNAELKEMLEYTGFKRIRYFYPIPDHILTDAVFSESILTGPYDVSQVFAGYKSQSIRNPTVLPDCDEQLAWIELGRNRLIPTFANSFCIIADKCEGNENVSASWDAITFTTKRLQRFWNVTLYQGFDSDIPFKTRFQLYPEAVSSHGCLRFPMKPESASWIEGDNLLLLIKKHLAKDSVDIRELMGILERWADYLFACQSGAVDGVVNGQYLDAIPQNMILTKSGDIVFVDDEWEWTKDLGIRTIVLRGLYGVFLSNRRALRRHNYLGNKSKLGFMKNTCEVLAGRPALRDWYHFIQVHMGIWKELRGRPWFSAPIVIAGNIIVSEKLIELMLGTALPILQKHRMLRPLALRLRGLIH